MVFSEDSRVKIPCILHLVRLGYRYLSLKNAIWDEETNIFPTLFNEAIARINTDLSAEDITRLLADVKLLLDNEDLGNAFYDRLSERSGVRLIDFENFDNNSFHVVTELTCKNGDDEFRPDITLLINGMPLVFIEVKKPNNREGVLAERNRIIARSRNPRFTQDAIKANRGVIDLLERIAAQKEATPAQIALAWLLAQKPWIVPIPGTTKAHRLTENIGAAFVELTADDLHLIDGALARIELQGERYPAHLEALTGR